MLAYGCKWGILSFKLNGQMLLFLVKGISSFRKGNMLIMVKGVFHLLQEKGISAFHSKTYIMFVNRKGINLYHSKIYLVCQKNKGYVFVLLKRI